jgi:hypothetical protein
MVKLQVILDQKSLFLETDGDKSYNEEPSTFEHFQNGMYFPSACTGEVRGIRTFSYLCPLRTWHSYLPKVAPCGFNSPLIGLLFCWAYFS